MAKYEGAGGYGVISTMNQDQRQGKYYPHVNIFLYKEHPVIHVKCLTCLETWDDGEPFPPKCKKKDEWVSAEEILKG